MSDATKSSASWKGWTIAIFLVPIVYVLSSGPMIGLACWLRETTGHDEFYYVIWFYAPLFLGGHHGPLGLYIEWWVVDVFRTVGPG